MRILTLLGSAFCSVQELLILSVLFNVITGDIGVAGYRLIGTECVCQQITLGVISAVGVIRSSMVWISRGSHPFPNTANQIGVNEERC